jgi:hypothetical protein
MNLIVSRTVVSIIVVSINYRVDPCTPRSCSPTKKSEQQFHRSTVLKPNNILASTPSSKSPHPRVKRSSLATYVKFTFEFLLLPLPARPIESTTVHARRLMPRGRLRDGRTESGFRSRIVYLIVGDAPFVTRSTHRG